MVIESRFTATKDVIRTMEIMATREGISGAALGPSSNVKRRMNDNKQKVQGHANSGSTREAIVVPPALQKTLNDEPFLLYENAAGPNRMLIFASRDALDVSSLKIRF